MQACIQPIKAKSSSRLRIVYVAADSWFDIYGFSGLMIILIFCICLLDAYCLPQPYPYKDVLTCHMTKNFRSREYFISILHTYFNTTVQ